MDHDARDAEDARLLAERRYDELFATWLPVIETRVYTRVRGADGDEVVSDVLNRLWTDIASGRQHEHPFRVIVHQTIKWALLDFWRRSGRLPGTLPDGYDGVSIDYLDFEEVDAVERRIAGLPDRQREALLLLWVHDWAIVDVAAHFGITRNAADQLIHRAIEKLRDDHG